MSDKRFILSVMACTVILIALPLIIKAPVIGILISLSTIVLSSAILYMLSKILAKLEINK